MTDEQCRAKHTKNGLVLECLFVFFFGLYIVNVLIGKAIIVFEWKVFHFGGVGEFLILFSAAVTFTCAALQAEAACKNRKLNK